MPLNIPHLRVNRFRISDCPSHFHLRICHQTVGVAINTTSWNSSHNLGYFDVLVSFTNPFLDLVICHRVPLPPLAVLL